MDSVTHDSLREAAARQAHHPFAFTGSGGEYFRIWLVNLLLTILTLGIYSAWAKVRRERYFHRNTLVDGSAFEYHGNPIAILKGRLLVVGFLVVQNLAGGLSPIVAGILSILLVAGMPWIICQAMRFRAANSSWRGVHMGFSGTAAGMARVYLLNGLLVLITLGLAMPWWLNRFHRYIVSNLKFGDAQFNCAPPVRKYYAPIFAMLGFILLFIVALVTLTLASKFSSVEMDKESLGALILVFMIGFYVGLLFISTSYVRARLSNAMWNFTTLQNGRFESRLRARSLFGIQLVNWIAIILTLGLFTPYAKIRMARYRAETFALSLTDLEGFVGEQTGNNRALGDEAAEIFDVDLGF